MYMVLKKYSVNFNNSEDNSKLYMILSHMMGVARLCPAAKFAEVWQNSSFKSREHNRKKEHGQSFDILATQ